jgi:3-dehydroquinate synthase
MSRTISINFRKADDRSYRIVIERGGMRRLPDRIARTWRTKRVFILTDSNVERLWGRKLQLAMHHAGSDVLLFCFPAGEESKRHTVVHALHTQLLTHGVRRDSVIVALGGGVVGDVAGFVAATLLRGVAFLQVPTTLLSQVDSSVGGKVGINHPRGKNLIGAFYQPRGVFIDPEVLRTLPAREFRSGLAEVVKIAAALDRPFFDFLEQKARMITKENLPLMEKIIAHAVGLKARIVRRDEFENATRKILNLGHTLGHAIEAATDFSLRHGEAVAIGLAAEARIAVRLGLLQAREGERLIALLKTLQLPTRIPSVSNTRRLYAALAADKKALDDHTSFVLLRGIGRPVVGVHVPQHEIEFQLHVSQ